MTSHHSDGIDAIPEGFVPTGRATYFDSLGVDVVMVRNTGFCVPEWANRLLQFRNKIDLNSADARFIDLSVAHIARLDSDARNALMTVFDLGGIQALMQSVLEQKHAKATGK